MNTPGTPEEMRAMVAAETQKWTRVVAEAKIQQSELEKMLTESTPFTHEWANRRWFHWMMKFNRHTDTLERMAIIPTTTRTGMWEDCESCDGDGCVRCGWLGEVWRPML